MQGLITALISPSLGALVYSIEPTADGAVAGAFVRYAQQPPKQHPSQRPKQRASELGRAGRRIDRVTSGGRGAVGGGQKAAGPCFLEGSPRQTLDRNPPLSERHLSSDQDG